MWSIESLSMLLYRRDFLTAAIGLGATRFCKGGRLTIAFELGIMPCM